MTTLVLLRHAKAAAQDPGGDHDRPLNERGRIAAAAAGALLANLSRPIDLALVSDAKRTRQTAELVFAALPSLPQLRVEPNLYGASPSVILALLRALTDGVESVLVVGHNPGLGELARQLSGSGDPDAILRLRDRFPTASAAILDFGGLPWPELHAKAGTLVRFWTQDEAE